MTINLTDPANHPANSPLTGERIERVIEALESSLKYRNGSSMDHFIADAVKGLRELLVSREVVPVAYIFKHPAGKLFWALTDESNKGQSDVMPVYAAPPAPVVLPKQHWEELCLQHPDMSIGDAIIRAAWWNHCVAMLQESPKGAGAPQNCRSNENVQVVDRQSVDGVGHPQSEPQNSQQNIPENILTVRGAVTAIRNSGVAIDAEKILAERDALNSPATPDGWVIVPKELTCEMDDAAWQAYHETRSMSDIWEALLAAAPKEVG
nr:hypothetical protein [Kluyvera ascorbata]